MTIERLNQRMEVRRRLNEVYRLKEIAIHSGVDTADLDEEIKLLVTELYRKEGQAI
ncbi:hypothetical protein D3C87_1496680 [compost metagenome]|uniref:hypothetical protein n=1 Tax=Paenibacillus sp. SN-8-1 TaxID=3435409 RepID=UPI000FAA05DF